MQKPSTQIAFHGLQPLALGENVRGTTELGTSAPGERMKLHSAGVLHGIGSFGTEGTHSCLLASRTQSLDPGSSAFDRSQVERPMTSWIAHGSFSPGEADSSAAGADAEGDSTSGGLDDASGAAVMGGAAVVGGATDGGAGGLAHDAETSAPKKSPTLGIDIITPRDYTRAMALPWETLASVDTPDGALDLRRRGEKDFLITIRGRILMSSAAHRSEDALAKLACEGLRDKRKARVLVSGLGMGFTLRAALDELGKDARVTVAELNPVVVEWCKGPLASLTADAASDPRVKIDIVDVTERLADEARTGSPKLDAVILDMYEGPQTKVRPHDPLYGVRAVERVKQALVPGGIFAIWCEGASPGFEKNLEAAGFRFRLERGGRGARIHWVYVAQALMPPRA